MASGSSRQILELCLLFILVVLTDISEELSVQHVIEPVTTRDSDSYVILPCDFHTETYETPQITWYHEKMGERRLIMRYDIHNRLSSYGEFAKRLVRGDRGALVLLGPRSRDSGNYSCEVEVDNEIPSWVKSTVMLKVTKDSVGIKDDIATNTTLLISVYWFISVVCALLLNTRPRTSAGMICSLPRNMLSTQRTKQALLFLVIVLSMSSSFTGVICAVRSVTTSESSAMNSFHWRMSLVTGIPGVLILSVITVWPFLSTDACCKRICSSESSVQEGLGESPVQTTAASYIASTEREGAGSRLVKPVTNTPGVKCEFASPLVESANKLSIADLKTFTTPDKKRVTGMISWEYNEVYVTTTSTLFKINVTENGEINHFESIFERKEEFLSLGKYKDSLLICTDVKSMTDKHFVIKWVPSSREIEENLLQVKSTINWVQEGRGDGLVYVALSNPEVISKRNLEKKTGEQIWTSVLKKPECIVQNSRGQFIVADSVKSNLFVFGEDGEFLLTMKVFVPKEYEDKLCMCNRIAIGVDDMIFVSSPKCRDVLVFNKDFRFERLFSTSIASKSAISCLLVHSNSLYVAHDENISVYPLCVGVL